MTFFQEFCGSHCGITGPRAAHCDCEMCHNGTAPVIITRDDLAARARGVPMCARWYERAGGYQPWHSGGHAPPKPPMTADQEELLRKLIGKG